MLGDAVRRLMDAAVLTAAEDDERTLAAKEIEAIAARLEDAGLRETMQSRDLESMRRGERPYSPVIGTANPIAPPLTVRMLDDATVVGECTMRQIHEGPPGAVHGGWVSTYNGYGLNGTALDGTQVLAESPKVSTTSGVTHASLVNTTASFGDMDTTVRLRTVQQLRTPTPNAWEVAWVLWHYTDDTHFYYLALKPNGWELGKEDPAYPGAQRYLTTSSSPTYAVGAWHTVRVRQIGNVMTVWADGAQLASFTDNERPYTSGTLGLYNEDSLVHFDDVKVTTP